VIPPRDHPHGESCFPGSQARRERPPVGPYLISSKSGCRARRGAACPSIPRDHLAAQPESGENNELVSPFAASAENAGSEIRVRADPAGRKVPECLPRELTEPPRAPMPTPRPDTEKSGLVTNLSLCLLTPRARTIARWGTNHPLSNNGTPGRAPCGWLAEDHAICFPGLAAIHQFRSGSVVTSNHRRMHAEGGAGRALPYMIHRCNAGGDCAGLNLVACQTPVGFFGRRTSGR